MIYIVDEDQVQLRPLAIELQIRGYEVEFLENADRAFHTLSFAGNELEAAIIDVMLATAIDPKESIFSRTETDDFKRTGLVLLRELCMQNPSQFPKKGILFSMAMNPSLVRQIEDEAAQLKIPFLRKMEYASAYQLADAVESCIQR